MTARIRHTIDTLNDDLIGDIIPIEINEGMSISTLCAIETAFYMRLQLAQVSWDEELIYNTLCRERFEQLGKVLKTKYKTAEAINEKIEILERLVSIGITLNSDHLIFALEEADNLKELTGLTCAQNLRLDWRPDINSENESHIVAKLLPEANTSFEMATIALISDFINAAEREAVLNHYFGLFDAAHADDDTAELANLLALAAYWNSDPTIRPRLTAAANKAQYVEGLTLPERLVNLIAAEIYTRIDNITGKYEEIA